MYLYFDENGILREQINDKATRQGDIGNKIYVYFNSAIEPENIYVRYRNGNGILVKTQFDVSTTKVALQIPYNKNRDLKYFNYTDEFDFYVITIPNEVLEVAGATGCTVRFVQQEEDVSLSTFAFMVEPSVEGGNYVASDDYVSLAQYQYLLNLINQKNIDYVIFSGNTEEAQEYYFERPQNDMPFYTLNGGSGTITPLVENEKYIGITFTATEQVDSLVVFYFKG